MNAPIQQWIDSGCPCEGGNFVISGEILGTDSAMLKFGDVTVCEVLGYQLAGVVGAPVARMEPVWTDRSVRVGPGDRAQPYRVGIVVEWLGQVRRLGWEEAANRHRHACAGALALCLFDRYEWVEFVEVGGRGYILDLERLLPPYTPGTWMELAPEDRVEAIRDAEEEYTWGEARTKKHVYRTALQLNLLTELRSAVRHLTELSLAALRQKFHLPQHPLESLLCESAARAVQRRIGDFASY